MDIGMVDVDMEVEVEVMQEDVVFVGVEGGMVVETCGKGQDMKMVMADQLTSLKDEVISIFIHAAFSCPFSVLYIFKRTLAWCANMNSFFVEIFCAVHF